MTGLSAALTEPYRLADYPRAWKFPPACIDPRHLFWMHDVLCAGQFQHALEIGCLYGASSTAFVEAINAGKLGRATFCDIEIRDELREVLARCRYPDRIHVFEGRSTDLLRDEDRYFDFVFVDGDHRWNAVEPEVELLLQRKLVCLMAHDSSAHVSGFADCDGPPYLKWKFQTTAPYYCLEESSLRENEMTQRGMFFATTSMSLFEHARQSLRIRGELDSPQSEMDAEDQTQPLDETDPLMEASNGNVPDLESFAGVYLYQRVGHDERDLELRSDGTIGRGAARAERTWHLVLNYGQPELGIAGDHGEICRLSLNEDRSWQGRWLKFEQMDVRLTPTQSMSRINFGARKLAEVPPEVSTQPDRESDTNGHASIKPAPQKDEVAGRYLYRRVYHDERMIQLLPDGLIGEGAAGGERRWALVDHLLEFSGDYGLLCRLRRDSDGVWRGNWIEYGRMPIELYSADQTPQNIPPMPRKWSTFTFPEQSGFWWSNYECLGQAVRKLCRQLPPLRAVAGIPRSGIIPASLIAQWQNIPLLDIDEALTSRPFIPTYRRRSAAEVDERLPILIVDDTVSSGRTLSWYQSRVQGKGNYLFAAPYVDRRCRSFVDFDALDHPQCYQAFEWNLLHEIGHTQIALCDLDGVISEDWSGNEEQFPNLYQAHLTRGRPLRLPTMKLRGIVTGRMHIYRPQTEAWLKSHKVNFQELWMLPAHNEQQRERIGPARFKAEIYAQSGAGLFIESCPAQAQEIHQITGKPVIDFTNMIAHGASLVH